MQLLGVDTEFGRADVRVHSWYFEDLTQSRALGVYLELAFVAVTQHCSRDARDAVHDNLVELGLKVLLNLL